MVSAVMEEIPSDQSPRPKRRATRKDVPNLRSLPADVGGELVQLFKLLADETRLQVLFYLLQENELNVGTLCALLNQSQPAVSHHLALMRVAGLIEMRRDGKHNFYRVRTEKFHQYREVLESVWPKLPRIPTLSSWLNPDNHHHLDGDDASDIAAELRGGSDRDLRPAADLNAGPELGGADDHSAGDGTDDDQA